MSQRTALSTAIAGSVLLGAATALLAQGQPPVPVPGESAPFYWVAWGPMMALGFLAFLYRTERAGEGRRRFAVAAGCVAVAALYVGLTLGSRSDALAELASAHLLFLSWAAVAGALVAGYRDDRAPQAFSTLVKSAETLLTGGIFFASGMLFAALTYGIFEVLGVTLPENVLVVIAAFGVGAIPLLAFGVAHDPSLSPAAQDGQAGLTRTMRLVARILLPLALFVLLVYVAWFIPTHFLKAFEEREALFVYNATIMAILVLLTVAVSGPEPVGSETPAVLFRLAVLAMITLTLALNVYALAAVVSRTVDGGLTPNRLAVIGWNVVTLVILGGSAVRLWTRSDEPWVSVLRKAIGTITPLAAAWALVLMLVLPLFG